MPAGQRAVPVELLALGSGGGPLGGGLELETSLGDEIGRETDLDEPVLEETVAAVADAVGAKAALLDDPALTEAIRSGSGRGRGGEGRGVDRGAGTGSGVVRRWEVRFLRGNTLQTYARQLDFFGIELGALMPGNKVVYAYHFSQPQPTTRAGAADQEKRYYLTWRSGELQEADRELLARAGISTADRIVLKFLPPELEARLAHMEKARAGAEARNIGGTRLGIRPEGEGYAFYVLDQWYR